MTTKTNNTVITLVLAAVLVLPTLTASSAFATGEEPNTIYDNKMVRSHTVTKDADSNTVLVR